MFALHPCPRDANCCAAPTWWRPQRFNKDGSFLRFQYQLQDSGNITYVPGVQVYAIDFDTAETAIPALRARDRNARFICYFSAGSWEDFRLDDDSAKRGIKPTDWGRSVGAAMDGWPGEKWVDVRSQAVRTIMTKRLQHCKKIGCHGVDPDNVNGHDQVTGFPLTAAHIIAYNRFLANTAHSLGLAIGLKNTVDLAPQLHTYFDWALSEECYTFGECGGYKLFAASKPIFGVEYCDATAKFEIDTLDPACFCAKAKSDTFNFLFKRVDLDASGISCTQYCKRATCVARPSCVSPRPGRMCSLLPRVPAL